MSNTTGQVKGLQFEPENVVQTRFYIALDLSASTLDYFDYHSSLPSTPLSKSTLLPPIPKPMKQVAARRVKFSTNKNTVSPLPPAFPPNDAPQEHTLGRSSLRTFTTPAAQPFYILLDTVQTLNQQRKPRVIRPLPTRPSTPPPHQPTKPHTPTKNYTKFQSQNTGIHDKNMDDDIASLFLSPSRSAVIVHQKPPPVEYLNVEDFLFSTAINVQKLRIDPELLPGPQTTQYFGTRWSNNSCWLDSSEWEPFYLIAWHDRMFWSWPYYGAHLTHPTTSRLSDYQRCFAARDLVYLCAQPEDIPLLLDEIRNSFQSRLQMPRERPVLTERAPLKSPFVSNPVCFLYIGLLTYCLQTCSMLS